jgi:checkpoint serine/threonine-protein kinase
VAWLWRFAFLCIQSNRNTPDDSNIPSAQKHTPEHHIREAINPRTGRRERVFVDLVAVYPDYKDPSHEICLEELRASHRGWLKKDWSKSSKPLREIPTNAARRALEHPETNNENIEHNLTDELKQKLIIEGKSSHQGDREGKLSKVKKIKVREINETQTGKFPSF